MWICHDCGTKYGKPRDGVATYHNGKCQWCGKDKAVTEDRDYGYPELPKKQRTETVFEKTTP